MSKSRKRVYKDHINATMSSGTNNRFRNNSTKNAKTFSMNVDEVVAVVILVTTIKNAINDNKTTAGSSIHPKITVMMAATVTIMTISEVVDTRNSHIM